MENAAVAAPQVTYALTPVAAPAAAPQVVAPQSLQPVVQGFAQAPIAFAQPGYAPVGGGYAPLPSYQVAPQQQYPQLWGAPQFQSQDVAQRYNVGPQQPQVQTTIQLSGETTDVVNALGVEAPAKLNQYALKLESALLEQHKLLQMLNQRNAAMEELLTNPDRLADYTVKYFTEVVPVQTPADQQPQQVQMTQEEYNAAVYAQQQAEYEQQLAYQQQLQAQQQYQYNPQAPQIPMGAGANSGAYASAGDYWASLRNAAQRNPTEAWKILSQMPPEALGSKLLFVDNQ